MMRIVMMVLCLVLALMFGCGDDGDDTGVVGTSSAASSTSTSVAEAETTANGIPLTGATPRSGWCDGFGECAGEQNWREWREFWEEDAGPVGTQDFCGCRKSAYQCDGAPFVFDGINDPLRDACAEFTGRYPFPRQ